MSNSIAFIAPEVFPIPAKEGGAVENWICIVSKLLKEAKVTICSMGGTELPSKEEEDLVFLRFKRNFLHKLLLISYKLPFKNSRSFYYWWFYARWCAKKCKEAQSKIIHVHNRWQFIPTISSLNPDAKIILHVHQLSALNFNRKQAHILKGKVDKYIGCSHFINEKIKEKFKVDEKKVTLVRNGVFEETFAPASTDEKKLLRAKYGFSDETLILYVGRLVENKGADVLIKAFNQLENNHHQLVVVGGNTFNTDEKTDYIKSIESIAKEKKKRINFLGHVERDELPEVYKMADIFVMPSQVEEALGMSLLEAMSSGLKVIASKRGGIVDLIEDGQNGLLVDDYSNPNALSSTIKKYLLDEGKYNEFKDKNLKRIESEFTWGQVSKQLEAVYDSVLKEAE